MNKQISRRKEKENCRWNKRTEIRKEKYVSEKKYPNNSKDKPNNESE